MENIIKEILFTSNNKDECLLKEKRIIACGVTLSTHLMYECFKEKGINVKKLAATDFMRIDKNEEPDVNYIKENL